MRFLALTAPLLLLTLPAATWAGGGHDATAVVEHIFDVADQDGDGVLSDAEYADAGLEQFGLTFDDCDANGDGYTSLDEYLALYRAHHPAHDERDA